MSFSVLSVTPVQQLFQLQFFPSRTRERQTAPMVCTIDAVLPRLTRQSVSRDWTGLIGKGAFRMMSPMLL